MSSANLDYFLGLLGTEQRIEAFRDGITAVVREGDRVLEIGSGLGTFAFFAAQAGAARVVGIDGGQVVGMARELARANGLSDRVEFLRGEFPEVVPEGPFDVVVFEDFPTHFMDGRIHGLLSALEPLAAEWGARLVPARARLCVAPVRAGEVDMVEPAGGGWDAYGVDWTALRDPASQTPRATRVEPGQLAGVAVEGAGFPLLPAPSAGDLSVEGAWTVDSPGVVGGLVSWFDLEVAPDVWVDNAPGMDGPWGQTFLPFAEPLPVHPGDDVHATVRRESTPGGVPGLTVWEACAGAQRRRGHEFGGLLLDEIPTEGA